MKRKLNLFVLSLLLVAVISCAGFISNSYKSLAVSKTTYETAMAVVADFQVKRLIDQVKRDQINKVAKLFKDSHNIAVDALETYARTQSVADKDKLSVAMLTAASKWSDVAKLINDIKPGTVPSQFGK